MLRAKPLRPSRISMPFFTLAVPCRFKFKLPTKSSVPLPKSQAASGLGPAGLGFFSSFLRWASRRLRAGSRMTTASARTRSVFLRRASALERAACCWVVVPLIKTFARSISPGEASRFSASWNMRPICSSGVLRFASLRTRWASPLASEITKGSFINANDCSGTLVWLRRPCVLVGTGASKMERKESSRLRMMET